MHEPWARDSVDFIAVVDDVMDLLNNEQNDDGDVLSLWGVEVKTRYTPNACNEEMMHMQNLGRDKHVHSIKDSEVSRIIKKISERS